MSDKILKLDQAQTLYQDLRGRIDALPTDSDIPEVPVQDVQVNGTSVLSNGIANVPLMDANKYGVARLGDNNGLYGLVVRHDGAYEGMLTLATASDVNMKNQTGTYKVITSAIQKRSVFWGLAQAAGDTTQSSSNNTVGTYTPSAKGAIQSMLGVSDLIATAENNLVASKAYAIGDVFTANGKLYKATAAIAADGAIITDGANANCEETKVGEGFVKFTDVANSTTPGVVRINGYGLSIGTTGNIKDMLYISYAGEQAAKLGISYYNPIVPHFQDQSVFYGLSKVAGVDLANETVTLGTYPETSKVAIRTMLGAVGSEDYATADNYGIVKLGGGLTRDGNGLTVTDYANSSVIKTGSGNRRPITPAFQHESVFYGLAAAAGDTTQKTASTFVGTYTDAAKSAIQTMLGINLSSIASQVEIPLVETVTGADVTINGQPNVRYNCGEVSTITINPPVAGSIDVIFTSGTSVAVLTLPSTVKMPAWFDATTLETDTIYEILITDGTYGSVMTWAN